MNKIRHAIGGLVIFAILIGLFMTIYNEGLEKQYDINRSSTVIGGVNTTEHIMEALDGLVIMKGINNITAIFDPEKTVNKADLIGAILLGAIGAFLFVIGILVLPFQIAAIVMQYFDIPPVLQVGLLALFAVYAAFIFISAKLGKDI